MNNIEGVRRCETMESKASEKLDAESILTEARRRVGTVVLPYVDPKLLRPSVEKRRVMCTLDKRDALSL